MTDDTSSSERFGDPHDGADVDDFAGDDRRALTPVDASVLDPAPTIEPVGGFPWPPSDDESVVAAFAQTWRGATLQPTRFFRALPEHGSIGTALLYYVPLGILLAGVDLFWSSVRGTAVEHDTVLGGLTAGTTMSPLVGFLLSPLFLLISLFLSSAVSHVLLKLFGGAKRDYAFTTRVFAFAYSPTLFAIVPVPRLPGTEMSLFDVCAIGWVVVVSIIGLKEGHRTTTGRAAAAILVPVVLLGLLLAFVLFVAAATDLLEVAVPR